MFFEFSEFKIFSDISYLHDTDRIYRWTWLFVCCQINSKVCFDDLFRAFKCIKSQKIKIGFFDFSDIGNISLIFVFFFADIFLKVRKSPLRALKTTKLVNVYQSRCYSTKNVFLGDQFQFFGSWMDLTGERDIRGNIWDLGRISAGDVWNQ